MVGETVNHTRGTRRLGENNFDTLVTGHIILYNTLLHVCMRVCVCVSGCYFMKAPKGIWHNIVYLKKVCI